MQWGRYQGRERLPCQERPELLKDVPIGMYHCPVCGMMQIAGLPHLPPDDPIDGTPYEQDYGEDWPAGYKTETGTKAETGTKVETGTKAETDYKTETDHQNNEEPHT